jgi:hypothetical protein
MFLLSTDRCRFCDRQVTAADKAYGPNGWRIWTPTCKHGRFCECPDCANVDRDHACDKCGCGEFYT